MMSPVEFMIQLFFPFVGFALMMIALVRGWEGFPAIFSASYSIVLSALYFFKGNPVLGYCALLSLTLSLFFSVRAKLNTVDLRFWFLTTAVQSFLIIVSLGFQLLSGKIADKNLWSVIQILCLLLSFPLVSLQFAHRGPWVAQGLGSLIVGRILTVYLSLRLISDLGGIPAQLAPLVWILFVILGIQLWISEKGLSSFLSASLFFGLIPVWVSAWGPPLDKRLDVWLAVTLVMNFLWLLSSQLWGKKWALIFAPAIVVPLAVEFYFGLKAGLDIVEQFVMFFVVLVSVLSVVREVFGMNRDTARFSFGLGQWSILSIVSILLVVLFYAQTNWGLQ